MKPRVVLRMVFNPGDQHLRPILLRRQLRRDPSHIPQPRRHQVLHAPRRVIERHHLQLRCAARNLRHCDSATGCDITFRISSSFTPGMAITLCRIRNRLSPLNPHRVLQQQIVVLRNRPMQAVLNRQHRPIHLARNHLRQHLGRHAARDDLHSLSLPSISTAAIWLFDPSSP